MSTDHRIELYDATLRDGMGGGGLTLTAEEKLRVVHALDELGVHMIEAGFPSSNPKEQRAVRAARRRAPEQRRDRRLRHDPPARRRAPSDDEGLRVLAECFAPVCTLVGKASVLHVEKVVRVSREENLAMIADSVAFLVGAGKRVLLDAEHFFDGFALDPGYALRLPARRRRGGRRAARAVRHQRRLAAAADPHGVRGRRAKRCRASRWASTPTTTPAARSPTR